MSDQPDDNQQQPIQTPPEPLQAPVAPQPPMPSAQPIYQQPPNTQKPGEGFAIASLVTSLLGISLLGLIFGIISLNETKKAGYPKNGMAIAGIIIGSISMAIAIIVILFMFIATIISAPGTSM